MSLNIRLIKFINSKNLRNTEFARSIGVHKQKIYDYKNDKSKPNAETLESILNAYPELNARWLLTGKGEMLNSETSLDKITENCNKCDDLNERLDEYKERVQELKERVEEQKTFNRTYQDTITMYQKRLEEYENPSGGLSKVSS